MKTLESLRFDNRFRLLPDAFFTPIQPTPLTNPRIATFSPEAAALLELDPAEFRRPDAAPLLAGTQLLPGMEPLAMVYGGHQFGVWNPGLGDGRGLLMGEVLTGAGERWDWHLKGAGQTPYSRFGDGRAVLRSCIREYLCSEAMHHLGIPTSRALCVLDSDTPVARERMERGAMLIRLAPSHVRFGHFEYFFYRNQHTELRQLLDYVIQRHWPDFASHPSPAASVLHEVVRRTAKLMADWQLIGFAHGVMNTDNFSLLGITFDYGPYGFLDDYDPGYICNHSDTEGRYAFNRQLNIGLWNLNALAHALSPLVPLEELRAALANYQDLVVEHWAAGLRAKLGLQTERPEDRMLAHELLEMLAANHVDYTIFFRRLCDFVPGQLNETLRDLFLDRDAFDAWAQQYSLRLAMESSGQAERSAQMKQVNPKYILRNYLAQIAIQKAEDGDYSEVEKLQRLLTRPYDEQPEFEAYAGFPPDWGKKLEISCSS